VLEWAVFGGLTAIGGAIVYAEWRFGLFDWLGDAVPERHPMARETVYAMFAVAQGFVVGITFAWKWSVRRRVLLGTSLALALVLTAVQIDAGWLGWALPAPGERGRGTWVFVAGLMTLNFLVCLAAVAVMRAMIERAAR
jgi:hypothetical protein